MNDWVLITGGSYGIGFELAKIFAAHRRNLILVARQEARLRTAADALRASGVEVRTLAKDLSVATSPREIFDALRDTPVSILVNNAGFGWRGGFVEGDLARSLEMMHVNMDALVELTHRFAQPMIARHAGRILNVSSMAAFQPGPFSNVYFATKAVVFSFSVALAEELAGTGVTVTALCPGSTRTEFFDRAEMKNVRRDALMMDAGKVARIGYRALMRGRRVVVPGAMNKVAGALARRLPATFTARMVRKINGR